MQKKRNHYYHGKLLKSDDFCMEQEYLLEKLKTLVTHLSDTGRLCGLQLSQKDGTHLLLSRGCAVDHHGNIIELDQDLLFTLQECDGFDHLDGYSGYLTLRYHEEQSERLFQSYSTAQNHEEFDYLLDGFQLHIDEKDPNQQLEQGFIETVVYQDKDMIIKRYLPSVLPRHGDVQFWLCIEQLQESAGRLFYDMESSHYTLKPSWHSFQKKGSTWIKEALYCIPEIAGEKALFQTKQLCVIKGKKEKQLSHQEAVYLPFSDNIKEELLKQYQRFTIPRHKEIYLGYVAFSYLSEEFQIMRLEQAIEYASTEKARTAVRRTLALYGIREEQRPSCKTEEIASGVVHVVVRHKEIWKSDEIEHGLDSSYVAIELGWMIQPDKRDRTLCFGNADLTAAVAERFLYTIRTYPNRGTFQIFIQPTSAMLHQEITLHWIARSFAPNRKETHLISLRPQFVTLQPTQLCMFLPIFDEINDNEAVSFQLENDQDGSIQKDGSYIAPSHPGLYQVKAIYRDQEVLSYVKVMQGNECS